MRVEFEFGDEKNKMLLFVPRKIKLNKIKQTVTPLIARLISPEPGIKKLHSVCQANGFYL